jgi:hypothetical protein
MILRVAMNDGTASTPWLTVVSSPRTRIPAGGTGGGTIYDPPSEVFPPEFPEDSVALMPRPPVPPVVAELSGGRPTLRVLRGAPIGGPHALAFELPAPADVRLELFDLAGRRIATLADGAFGVGAHVRPWDGRDASGNRVPRGLVFARLTAAGETRTARLLIER